LFGGFEAHGVGRERALGREGVDELVHDDGSRGFAVLEGPLRIVGHPEDDEVAGARGLRGLRGSTDETQDGDAGGGSLSD